jgi:hypothetical protein
MIDEWIESECNAKERVKMSVSVKLDAPSNGDGLCISYTPSAYTARSRHDKISVFTDRILTAPTT